MDEQDPIKQTLEDDQAAIVALPAEYGVWKVETNRVDESRVYIRVNENPLVYPMGIDEKRLNIVKGALSGTTGRDGFWSLRARPDGTVEVENRSGMKDTITLTPLPARSF